MAQWVADNLMFQGWDNKPTVAGFWYDNGEPNNLLPVEFEEYCPHEGYSSEYQPHMNIAYRPHCVDPNFRDGHKYGKGSTQFDKHGLFPC